MIVLSFNNPYKSNDDEKISQIIIMSLKHIVTGTYVMHKKKTFGRRCQSTQSLNRYLQLTRLVSYFQSLPLKKFLIQGNII